MVSKALLSSNNTEWATPQRLFEELDLEFGFDLDPCATAENAKCEKYYTQDDDGLTKPWNGRRVFCNPPYGRELHKWVQKGYEEGHKAGTLVVMLIPARTDTRWFHDLILHRSEIRFIQGRLRFEGALYNAPFPSMVVVFRGPGVR